MYTYICMYIYSHFGSRLKHFCCAALLHLLAPVPRSGSFRCAIVPRSGSAGNLQPWKQVAATQGATRLGTFFYRCVGLRQVATRRRNGGSGAAAAMAINRIVIGSGPIWQAFLLQSRVRHRSSKGEQKNRQVEKLLRGASVQEACGSKSHKRPGSKTLSPILSGCSEIMQSRG